MAIDKREQLASLKIERGAERAGSMGPWLALAVLALILVAAGAYWWNARTAVAVVRTARAREVNAGEEQTVLNASGYVTARRQATVSSKVTGRVLEVLIEEGMEVRKGQLLATLDDSNARVSLDLAVAQVASASGSLQETQVRIHEAELELERTRQLVARQILSAADLDRAEAQVDSLKARIDQQTQEIEVARRRVALWEQEVADRKIRAPFDGVVVTKNAQPGEMISPVSAGGGFTRTGIGTVVDMSSLEIEVDVNESYINRVQAGQGVEAVLDAYPDWRIPASVIAIVPTADRQRATVKVRIGFEELDPRVLPDMGVKVAFRGAEIAEADAAQDRVSQRVILVAQAAVRDDGGQAIVLVVRDGVVERRAVRTGDISGTEIAVLAGLEPGEVVVIEGPPGLEPGTTVREADE